MRALRHFLHRLQRPARYAELATLQRHAALGRDELRQFQRKVFAQIVTEARQQVPFYADRLAGLDLSDPRDLPVLSKDDVRTHLDQLLNKTADRSTVKLGHTGGSTGKPLAFWYDETKHELMRAGMMRGFMMSGWQPGQKVLYFWGARQDTAKGGIFGGGWQDIIAAEHTIAATQFDEASLHRWARTVQQYRPTLLYGYPSAMSALARYVLDTGLTLPNSLIGVYATAEMLLEPQRDLMQRAFGCKVFNQYGCREVPNIAWECRHGHMHVFTDLVLLESQRIHEENRLLVTSLTNRLMPFIRYDLGDSGRLLEGACDCGSPFPMMEMGLCRQNDLIRTPGGKSIHPGYFHHLLDGQASVREFQWVQRTLEVIELNLVSDAPLGTDVFNALQTRLQLELDPRMTLAVNYLPAIPRTSSGKHRFVIGLG